LKRILAKGSKTAPADSKELLKPIPTKHVKAAKIDSEGPPKLISVQRSKWIDCNSQEITEADFSKACQSWQNRF
jgi:hypothetical protein